MPEEPREGGEPTTELVRAAGAWSVFVRCDVSSVADLEAAVTAADGFGSGLTVMVNNAGILRAEDFPTVTEAEYQQVMDVNVKGTFFRAQAALRSMVASGRRGSIINLSSLSGLQGAGILPSYNASKGPVRLLTRSLVESLGLRGIRVNAVHPGVIETEATSTDAKTPLEQMAGVTPLRRTGQPDDIADAVVYLTSDFSSYVNGHSLLVDGGLLRI